jgi:GT2 family glycosyltransferase
MRKLDIGVASYGASDSLKRTLESIKAHSVTDFRCWIIDNPGPDPNTRPVIERFAAHDSRFIPVFLDENVGYAGAVAHLMRTPVEEPGWEHIAYCDNDVVIHQHGWDEILCDALDKHPEVGMVFPNGGAYEIERSGYREVMWGVGFCWATSRKVIAEVGVFDTEIGHQNECDYCLRVRMEGYRCAALPGVRVDHAATASNNPEAQERINRGVAEFVDKWVHYFCGKSLGYHSLNMLRWEDWPPNALYLEEYWKERLPGLNDQPEEVVLEGRDYDLIRVPRLQNLYRGRIV